MSCHHPRLAFYTGVKNPDTGKDVLVITFKNVDAYPVQRAEQKKKIKIPYNREFVKLINNELFLTKYIQIPCGVCRGCAATQSREWSVRLVLESTLYVNNWFVTLTYDQEYYPKDHLLHKKELQNFMKRLRDRYGYDAVRYFGCGEHGDKTDRCHFHLCLLNLDLPVDDLKFKTLRGKDLVFTSKLIAKCWPFGAHEITDLSFKGCAYVAGYCTKKLVDRKPDEFRIMSRRPGIGGPWFELHKDELNLKEVYVPSSDKPSVSPGYFDYLMQKCDPDKLAEVKLSRRLLGEMATDSWIANHTGINEHEMGFYKDDLFDKNRKERKGI